MASLGGNEPQRLAVLSSLACEGGKSASQQLGRLLWPFLANPEMSLLTHRSAWKVRVTSNLCQLPGIWIIDRFKTTAFEPAAVCCCLNCISPWPQSARVPASLQVSSRGCRPTLEGFSAANGGTNFETRLRMSEHPTKRARHSISQALAGLVPPSPILGPLMRRSNKTTGQVYKPPHTVWPFPISMLKEKKTVRLASHSFGIAVRQNAVQRITQGGYQPSRPVSEQVLLGASDSEPSLAAHRWLCFIAIL